MKPSHAFHVVPLVGERWAVVKLTRGVRGFEATSVFGSLASCNRCARRENELLGLTPRQVASIVKSTLPARTQPEAERKAKQTMLRLLPDIEDALRELAHARGETMAEVVTGLVLAARDG